MSNRKRTAGRIIQTIEVPVMVKSTNPVTRETHLVMNEHPKAGKMIQIKHKPTPFPPPKRKGMPSVLD